MVRQLPVAGIRAALRWQRTHRQSLRIDRNWIKNLKFPIKQNPIDEPQSTRAANIWSAYLGYANKLDHDLVERWKGDMDGILIFSGLFSAVVTTFIVETYKLLQPDNTQVSAELLVRVVAALENTPAANVASTLSIGSPPSITISLWINCLWFISLFFSLTCALIATLVQQWSREYLQSTERRASPTQRARFRAYFAKGVERFGADTLVGCIPLLLHFAVLLFIVGLVVFAFTVHNVLAYVNLVAAILAGVAYGFLTLIPVFVYACPYKTPLSNMLQRAIATVQTAFRNRTNITGPTQRLPVEDALYKTDPARALEMDNVIIKWTMDTWTDDHDLTDANLEALFGTIPDMVRRVRKEGRVEDAIAVVQELLFEGVKVGHEIPRLMRACTRVMLFETVHPWQVVRVESCLQVLLLLIQLAGSERMALPLRTEIAEHCLYPALEDIKLVWNPGFDSSVLEQVVWRCMILLPGLVLRRYRECLKKVEADIEDSPMAFTQATKSDVRELFRIRNRLNAIIQPYVTTVIGKGKNMYIPRDSPLQILADQLVSDEVTDPSFEDIDGLKSFVQEQLVLVKDAYHVYHLMAGVMTMREAGLFPDRSVEEEDTFKVASVPLDWEEPSKYDEAETVKDAIEGLLYIPADEPSVEPTTNGIQVNEEVFIPPLPLSPTAVENSTETNAHDPPSPQSDADQDDIYSTPLGSVSSIHGSNVNVSSRALETLVITDEPTELSAYDRGGRAKQSSLPPLPATPSTQHGPPHIKLDNEQSKPRPGLFCDFWGDNPEAVNQLVQKNLAIFRRTEVIGGGGQCDVGDEVGRSKDVESMEAPVQMKEGRENVPKGVGTRGRRHWDRLTKSLRLHPKFPVVNTDEGAAGEEGKETKGQNGGSSYEMV